MKASLKKLNPWISAENAEKVVCKFSRAESLGGMPKDLGIVNLFSVC